MVSKAYGVGIYGVEGMLVCCETDVSNGLPGISIIGYLSSQVREATERVRSAIKNAGVCVKPKKVVINLSPADIKKEGSGFDLTIAVAMLLAYGAMKSTKTKEAIFVGELSLSGEILPVHGALVIAETAKKHGFTRLFLPVQNAKEAAVMEGISCIAVSNLKELIQICNDQVSEDDFLAEVKEEEEVVDGEVDFSDILGQEFAKQATIIAVAGHHNILYIGAAGRGKTMLAMAIPKIMPLMSKEERLEISKIQSICGLLPKDCALVKARPFRAPHHTISASALCGGGQRPRPGEITMASGGVLFLDEFAEFRPNVLDGLRQPLEEKCIRITRWGGSYTFPADFMLCGAMNPCRCGFYPDRSRCHCTPGDIARYRGRISRPIVDRMDICVEINARESIKMEKGESSISIREKIMQVVEIQRKRFAKSTILWNAQMDAQMILRYCQLLPEDEQFLQEIYVQKGMSVRSLQKVKKVARTIADFSNSEQILRPHLAQALSFRVMEEKYWGGESNASTRH